MAILSDKELKAVLSKLNPKQKRFAEEYCIDLNGTQAVIRAGYSENGARVTASRALTNPNISLYIAHLKATQTTTSGVTAERIVEELAKIAFLNPADLMEYQDGNLVIKDLDDIKNPEVIKSIKVRELTVDGNRVGNMAEITLQDKLKALELLGKHTAIFTDNVNLTNNGKDFEAPKQTTIININHRKAGDKIQVQK